MQISYVATFSYKQLNAFANHLHCQMQRLATLLPHVALVAVLAIPSGPALAAEGGSGFYLLGQRAQGAALLPTVEGVFFSTPTYFYSGDVSNSEAIDDGGVTAFGLDTDIFLLLPTALWITPYDLFGGNLGFSGTFVYGTADVSASFGFPDPELGPIQIDLNDDRWAIGDPAVSAFLGWSGENYAYTLTSSVNIPAGDYDVGRISNIALNYWALDITAAGTWLLPENKIELSGAAGLTFNDENDDTKYETGTEFHLEGAAYYQFTSSFSAGLNGYYYNQISGDSGEGATLGNQYGRVAALGPGLASTFNVGPVPVSVSFRYYHEFSVKNRLEGDAAWLTFFVPLWVPDRT